MKMHSTTEGRVTGLSMIVCHVQKHCTQLVFFICCEETK